jgi:hypothetical protein
MDNDIAMTSDALANVPAPIVQRPIGMTPSRTQQVTGLDNCLTYLKSTVSGRAAAAIAFPNCLVNVSVMRDSHGEFAASRQA